MTIYTLVCKRPAGASRASDAERYVSVDVFKDPAEPSSWRWRYAEAGGPFVDTGAGVFKSQAGARTDALLNLKGVRWES